MQKSSKRTKDIKPWKEIPYPVRTVRVFASLLMTASVSFWSGEALPTEKNAELCDNVPASCVLEHCDQLEQASCFGIALDECVQKFPGEAAIPLRCWEEELAVWKKLMTQTRMELLQDMEQRGYGTFISQVEAAQSHWQVQSRLDCEIQVAATPPTHGTAGIACMAQAIHDRVLFLRELFGADWTE